MIRRATPQDLRLVHHLERACFGRRSFSRQHIAHVLQDGESATYLYYEDGTPVACLMLHDEREALRVVSVGVHPKWQRRGIGQRLMALAEDEARARGAKEVRLEVSTSNRPAVDFYRALGYDAQGLIPHYYSWGEDAYVMVKSLARPSPGNA